MPFFRRRPLLRAAAVGGGAYYMGKRHAESQGREAEQDAQIDDLQSQQAAPAPAPAPAPTPASGGISSDMLQRLSELGKLHEQGVLTDDEFSQQKAKLLAS
jgi:Short C-terminal domain